MRKIVPSIILITSLASPCCGYMSHLHVMFGLADIFLLVLNNYIFDTSTPAGKSWHKTDRIAHKAELICADLDLLLRLVTPSLLGNHEATLNGQNKTRRLVPNRLWALLLLNTEMKSPSDCITPTRSKPKLRSRRRWDDFVQILYQLGLQNRLFQ